MKTTDLGAGTTLPARSAQLLGGEDDTEGSRSSEEPDPKLGRGDVLAGRYVVDGELGRGAGSRVFRAYDRATKTAVAVKVLTGTSAAGPEWLERLGRELRLGRQGRHANVCEVFDIMEAEGCRFLTMALATGGTLRDTLTRAPERSWPERIADARAVVSGLAALHADGIVHRDMKPENILRMADGRLVLSDLGLAVSRSPTTFTGSDRRGAGTPPYMAPEVALGGEASPASDVFSFGVVLHEILFGRRPEWGGPGGRRFVATPAILRGPRVQAALSQLCLACLEPIPGRRPQSAVEVKARFERAVVGRFGSFKRAMSAGKWGLAAGLVLAIVVSGTVAWLARKSSDIENATLVGVPADWSRNARLLARLDGGIRCVYPSPDGRTIGLTGSRGSMLAAVKLDVRNGQSSPWPLTPDSYAYDCPQFSSDGRSLLYYKDGQILVADALGSSPRVLGKGGRPRWLPSENEVVHAFDARRLATTDLRGNMALLPEVPISEVRLLDLLVDRQTREVVAHYRREPERSSVLVFFDTETGKIRRQVLLPVRVRAPFIVAPGAVSMVLRETPLEAVGLLMADGTIRRQGSLGSSGLMHAITWQDHLLITHIKPTTTLSVRDRNGRERIVATALFVGHVSVARDGQAVFEQQTQGGNSSVVNHYDPRSSQIRALTSGGQEVQPFIQPDGSGFFYVDGNAQSSLKFCALPDNSKCDTLLERGLMGPLGVSPSGQRVVVSTRDGLRARLRVLSLQDRSLKDLGPVVYHCPVRWDDEDRLWTYARTDDFSGWTELDVRSGRPTGNRKLQDDFDEGEVCPPPETAPDILKRVWSMESELWRVPIDD